MKANADLLRLAVLAEVAKRDNGMNDQSHCAAFFREPKTLVDRHTEAMSALILETGSGRLRPGTGREVDYLQEFGVTLLKTLCTAGGSQ